MDLASGVLQSGSTKKYGTTFATSFTLVKRAFDQAVSYVKLDYRNQATLPLASQLLVSHSQDQYARYPRTGQLHLLYPILA